MATLMTGPVKSVSLPPEEADLARESGNALADFMDQETQPLTLRLENGQTGHQVEATVPAGAVRVLAEILGQMAQGRPITLVPLQAELSTQQAADLLGVSRPFFVNLLEQGKIPFRKVGEQRRVRYEDLLRYMEDYQRAANEALAEMTAEAQRLGLYE